MTDGHGDDLYRYGGRILHNFSSNIFTGIDHAPLMRHLAGCEWCVKRYPEPEPYSLEKRIAADIGVDAENVIVTNGATEAIYLMAQFRQGATSHIVVPTFREYQDACKLHSHEIHFTESVKKAAAAYGDMVWMCNPNNPTGEMTPAEELLRLASVHKEKIFVIDQAYALYTSLPVISAREAVDAGNILLLSSLTKDFAIPGMRIGYAVGAGDIIAKMKGCRMPWAVNALAIEAATYLLDHKDEYHVDAALLHREALRITKALSDMGVKPAPTECNFILCELPISTSAELKKYLIDEYGILIRDASNFEGLNARHFRVAAQTPEENDLLTDAIAKWIYSQC